MKENRSLPQNARRIAWNKQTERATRVALSLFRFPQAPGTGQSTTASSKLIRRLIRPRPMQLGSQHQIGGKQHDGEKGAGFRKGKDSLTSSQQKGSYIGRCGRTGRMCRRGDGKLLVLLVVVDLVVVLLMVSHYKVVPNWAEGKCTKRCLSSSPPPLIHRLASFIIQLDDAQLYNLAITAIQ